MKLYPIPFQIRMRTLERKKSLTAANGSKRQLQAPPSQAAPSSEKNEFDDLISALRTGDVFGENMDKFRNRNRKTRHSPPRVDRMDSFLRERSQERRET